MSSRAVLWAGVLVAGACQVPEGPEQIVAIQQGNGGDGGDGVGMTGVDGGGGAGFIDVASAKPAPETWMEHWFEHTQLVKLIAQDENFALYCDDGVTRTGIDWLAPYLSGLWAYTKKTYGTPGARQLFVVLHGGRYPGGHAASVFDPAHDFRNVVDIGLEPGAWSTPAHVELLTGLAGAVLEGASDGVEQVPSQVLTEANFRQIYAYDALRALGMTASAEALLAMSSNAFSDSPRAGTHWFRDWYFPLWDEGGAAVFGRFMKLLFQHYPKVGRPDGNGATYAPEMNWGEYVHFMSGAAGRDLKAVATAAFGWPEDRDRLLQRAKLDYPLITYR